LKNRNISHIIRGRAQGFIPDLLVHVHRISAHNCSSSYGLGLPIYFSNYIIQKTTVRIKYNLQKNEVDVVRIVKEVEDSFMMKKMLVLLDINILVSAGLYPSLKLSATAIEISERLIFSIKPTIYKIF
jgi:hypothetical protein